MKYLIFLFLTRIIFKNNFLPPRPFHPENYEELEAVGIDEESRANFFVSLYSSMRCRFAKDEAQNLVYDDEGQPKLESNTRIVEWTDGSYSVHIGSEIYDMHKIDNTMNHSQLFIHQGSSLHAQGSFNDKLVLR